MARPTQQPSPQASSVHRGKRLDSWKEIAAYLNRNVRTAQRWERVEHLPVHRHKHLKNESVFAFAPEIETWRQKRESVDAWIDAVEQPSGRRVRLAVLPFENLLGSPQDEYLADGMTEEMIARLGRSHPVDLGLIARTTVMHYKGTEKSIEQIGKELRVDAVLEGSVRRAGERLRITAQLIRVSDQSHLWSETYDHTTSDVLDVQSSVAELIAKSLELQLFSTSTASHARSATNSPAAHDAYLRGRYFWNRRKEPEFFRALEYFKKAVELDPSYANAYSGLADIYNTLGWYGVLTGREAWERAESAARKALSIDGDLAEAHTSLAFALHSFAWDWQASEREYQRAIALDPNYVVARLWYAFFLMAMSRHEEAKSQMMHALALDPLSLVLNSYLGWVLYYARRYDEASDQLLKTLDMDPDFLIAHYILGLVYAQQGLGRKSVREFQFAREISGTNVLALSGFAHVLGLAKRTAEARKYVEKMIQLSKTQHVSPFLIAFGAANCGLREETFAQLERALEEHASWLPLFRVEPGLDSLREDPRFEKLLAALKFPDSPAPQMASPRAPQGSSKQFARRAGF